MKFPLGFLVFCFGICLGMATTGCAPEKKTPEQVKAESVQTATKLLPPGAKNITDLGERWFTFELDGPKGENVTHRFLYRYWYGSHAEVGHTVTCIGSRPTKVN